MMLLMELIRGLSHLKPAHKHCVATIGNFDGVHLGHQALLGRLREHAKALALPLLVILFEPHPNEYFLHGHMPARLMRLREKLHVLREWGVDRVLCLRFNAELAQMPALEFIRHVLIEKLAVHYLEVGDDFRFGYQRQGDVALLKQQAAHGHFQVEKIPSFQVGGERVSSTRIRALLKAADLAEAGSLLGRPFGVYGRVAHGDKRGRLLGFPTANIYLHRRAVPIDGIFAVKTYGLAEQPIFGVANVGTRPTFGGTVSLLEVFLFDFNDTIYGCAVFVEFCHKFRNEEHYDTLEALVAQMTQDAADARAYFGLS